MIKFIKKCRILLAILVITFAILFSVFRALTPWVKQYKLEIEQHLSALIGQPVTITTMETSWYWFEPVLKLNQVTVSDAQDHVLKFKKLLVGINLFSSLWHWEVQPGILYAADMHITLRQLNNRWQIDGLNNKQPLTLEAESYLPVLSWLLAQQKIIIKNAAIQVYLKDGTVLPVKTLNLKAVNDSGRYRLKGSAVLAQTTPTELVFLADMQLDPYALDKSHGHAYMSVKHFVPAQWQEFLPAMGFHLNKGTGSLDVWADLLKGRVQNVQAKLDFNHLIWRQNASRHSDQIQALKANLAWQPTAAGWQLSGDQIKLKMAGVRWPVNKILLTHNNDQNAYRFYIKKLLLQPLQAADLEWPKALLPIVAAHPQGELNDTQIEFKDAKINYLLTQFKHLAWNHMDKIPGVSNLSGVLNWQPAGGRLHVDGENTVMAPYNLPKLTLRKINGGFHWQQLAHGYRITMDQLAVIHPDLLLNARGTLEEPDDRVHMSAEFSANNVQQWRPYLPQHALKAKLYAWLQNDVKKIGHINGQLKINGALADFPFDKTAGEFTLNSHINQVELYINEHWPLSRDIAANLRIDKRNLDADILHADLQGILVNQMNLRMDDIGLDRETLLIHGKITAPADQVKSYVMTTPVGKPLSKLAMVDIQGDVAMDLRFQVPLYPENDDVLALGTIAFKNNVATVHHAIDDLALHNVSGTLEFDEHGVTDSALEATLLGDPVTMHIQSIRKKHPYTEIRIKGNTTVDLLKSKLNLPVLALFTGQLNLESLLTITDDPNDLDHIRLTTNLQGVAIDLPAPLGKQDSTVAPLTVDVDFNPAKAIRVQFNYDDRLSSDLWFMKSRKKFLLQNGEVRLGKGRALWKKQAGIAVVGSLPTLDIQQWDEAIAKVPYNPAMPRLVDVIQSVDILLDSMPILNHDYKQMAVKVNKLAVDDWAVKIKQQDISADLRYQVAKKSVSGHFSYLNIVQAASAKSKNSVSSSTLKPAQIPNLDLTVDNFKVGKMDLGQVLLKSTTSDTNWRLDDCKIKSAEYELNVKGDWRKDASHNSTNFQGTLKIGDLAKSLARWNISPVVEAQRGTIQFKGGWPGAVNRFSLANVSGELYMTLKNGRITNLSSETEEKLGLGKLLSILSLQTIPRRLKLDFSDLSKDGYSFDAFNGGFTLKNGVMSTDNSYIDGPVAYASMKGDLNVVKQMYNVDLFVSPHITASLPIVATIAGGPIAGLATWIASKIINQGMQKISGYTYKVSGPWLTPDVQQVSIIKTANRS